MELSGVVGCPQGGRDWKGAHGELLLLDLSAWVCSVWKTCEQYTYSVSTFLVYVLYFKKKEGKKKLSR